MPVAAQQQHFRRAVEWRRASVLDPVQGFLEKRKFLLAGKPDDRPRAGLPCASCGPSCGSAPGCAARIRWRPPRYGRRSGTWSTRSMRSNAPNLSSELPHHRDVRAAEPVDRLPVVADGEQLGVRVSCRAAPSAAMRPGRGDVLELVDQDVSERAAVAALLHEIGRPVDHVVEVDLVPERASDSW